MEMVKYGFMLPNGDLAKLDCEYNGQERYACGEYRYWLSEFGNNDFLVDTVDDLEKVLLNNTPWYNTSSTQPGWGTFKATDLTPCKVIITKTPIKIALRFILKSLLIRRWPHTFVRKVYPECSELEEYSWILCYQDKKDIMENIGKAVYINDEYMIHTLHSVIDVPDEYNIDYDVRINKKNIKVKPTCVAITSEWKGKK